MENLKRLIDRLPPWTLSIICFIAICWLTLASKPLGDTDIPLFPGADKIAHAIMFGGFTFCIIIDALRRKNWPPFPDNSRIFIYSPDIPCIVGIAIEFLQDAMHSGRSFEFWDMIADISGAWAASLIFLLAQQYLSKNKKS